MSGKETNEPTPEDWLAGADEAFVGEREISHPDPAFDDLRGKTSERLRIEHEVVAAKVDEGRVDGGAINGVGAPGR